MNHTRDGVDFSFLRPLFHSVHNFSRAGELNMHIPSEQGGVFMFTGLVRTIILYLLIIVGVRLMGKRQVGELEPSELVMSLIIADLAAVPMQDYGIPLLTGIIPILALLSLTMMLSVLTMRSITFRLLLCGRPSIIIRKGELDIAEMRRNRLTVDELLEDLRGKGYTDPSQVYYAVLETNGQLSILPKAVNKPPVNSQLGHVPPDEELPVVVVSDGKVLEGNLHQLGHDRRWLEKNLKGREIYIPKPLNITVNEKKGKLAVEVVGDEEAIVEEMGVCYAEADVNRRSIYREWQCVHKETGAAIKDGKLSCEISPFEGTTAAFVYAYAKYLNGFKIVTKVVAKRLSGGATVKTGSRMLFSGEDLDCFSVANHEDYSVAGIFLEREATPKLLTGYGNVQGAYSLGGIKTYKISSPRYVAQSGALLKFDAYSRVTESLRIGIEVAKEDGEVECYFCYVPVKGGGKWKRIILEAKDFKSELSGRALPAFSLGSALSFGAENEDIEYIVTNILWL